jgi:hypothetical protein
MAKRYKHQEIMTMLAKIYKENAKKGIKPKKVPKNNNNKESMEKKNGTDTQKK